VFLQPVVGTELLLREQAVSLELLERDQERAQREHRHGAVRGIARADGMDGKHLPPALPRLRQEIGEAIGLVAQIANPMAAGKGRDMKQNAAGTLLQRGHPHRSSSSRKATGRWRKTSPSERTAPPALGSDTMRRPVNRSR